MLADVERLVLLHPSERRRSSRRLSKQRRHALRNLVTVPFIYSLALPFALLDVSVSIYQWVCFPLYGIARAKRTRYFAFDRHRLPYLSTIAKANCLYCSYATGVLAYVREVASRTEQYWCPIKHARRIAAPHRRYRRFFTYGDGAGYQRGLPQMRRRLRPRLTSGNPRRY